MVVLHHYSDSSCQRCANLPSSTIRQQNDHIIYALTPPERMFGAHQRPVSGGFNPTSNQSVSGFDSSRNNSILYRQTDIPASITTTSTADCFNPSSNAFAPNQSANLFGAPYKSGNLCGAPYQSANLVGSSSNNTFANPFGSNVSTLFPSSRPTFVNTPNSATTNNNVFAPSNPFAFNPPPDNAQPLTDRPYIVSPTMSTPSFPLFENPFCIPTINTNGSASSAICASSAATNNTNSIQATVGPSPTSIKLGSGVSPFSSTAQVPAPLHHFKNFPSSQGCQPAATSTQSTTYSYENFPLGGPPKPKSFCGQQRGSELVAAAYSSTPAPDLPSGTLNSISAMPNYNGKSHEELRLEDYSSKGKEQESAGPGVPSLVRQFSEQQAKDRTNTY